MALWTDDMSPEVLWRFMFLCRPYIDKNSVHAVLLSVRPLRTENSVRLAYLSVHADGK